MSLASYEEEGRSGPTSAGLDELGSSAPVLISSSPATAEPVGRVWCVGLEEVDRAVESAAVAHSLWRGTTFKERKVRLLDLVERTLEQADEIAELIAAEQGKPVVEALTLEVLPALDHLRFLAGHAERLTTSKGIHPRQPFYAHKRSYYLYDSMGVIALITPCNLPFALPLIQTGAALAMGNAVVLKPSELTPLCGARVGELVEEAGFPSGLVNVLHTATENTLLFVTHPKVDKIFLTGSRETAHLVMEAAGWIPKPMVLSLGGKHPSIVAGDADVDRAARGVVWGALANCGQNCGAVERVYVEQVVAARFLERVLEEVDRLKMGDPLAENVDLGPLVSEARRLDVHAQVTEAVAAGAQLLRGGTIPDGPGWFYPPTVLLAPPPDCRLMRDETLGPVIPIVVVESIEQAILLANDSDYAMTASGWTASAANAERLTSALQAGVVTINDVLYSFGEPASTWSGHKASGLGHTHGAAGLREMCRQKFTSFDPLPAEAPVFAFPYDRFSVRIAQASLDALHASHLLSRLGSLLHLACTKRFRSRISLRSFLLAWKARSR